MYFKKSLKVEKIKNSSKHSKIYNYSLLSLKKYQMKLSYTLALSTAAAELKQVLRTMHIHVCNF